MFRRRQISRRRAGRRIVNLGYLGTPAVLAAVAIAGCGSASSVNKSNNASSVSLAPCLITSEGNKLCGQDAASWCQLADSQAVGSVGGINDPTTANACYVVQKSAHAPDGVIAYNMGIPNQGQGCYLNDPNRSTNCIPTDSPNASPN